MHLSRYEIDPALCRQCGACLKACPRQAIVRLPNRSFVVEQNSCDRCGTCLASCKLRAIAKRSGLFWS